MSISGTDTDSPWERGLSRRDAACLASRLTAGAAEQARGGEGGAHRGYDPDAVLIHRNENPPARTAGVKQSYAAIFAGSSGPLCRAADTGRIPANHNKNRDAPAPDAACFHFAGTDKDRVVMRTLPGRRPGLAPGRPGPPIESRQSGVGFPPVAGLACAAAGLRAIALVAERKAIHASVHLAAHRIYAGRIRRVWPTKAPVTVGRREETNKFQAVLEKILERGI